MLPPPCHTVTLKMPFSYYSAMKARFAEVIVVMCTESPTRTPPELPWDSVLLPQSHLPFHPVSLGGWPCRFRFQNVSYSYHFHIMF